MTKSSLNEDNYSGRFIFWLASVTFLFLFIPSDSFAVSARASLSPETFSITRPAKLVITVTDTQSAEIALPDVEGLAFHERGTNRQFQMINGKSSSSVTYTYLVQGLTSGSYTIPAIKVKVSGSTTETSPISCTVTDSPPPASSSGNPTPADTLGKSGDMDNIAFIRLVPEKTEGYVGEVIPARIEVYFNQGARARITSLPAMNGDGVLIDPLEDEPQQRMENTNGTIYNVVAWNTALTGIKEGTYSLEMAMNATIQVRSKQKRRLPPGFEDDFFNDRFFNDFFDQYENRPIRIVSPPITMNIIDLPTDGIPENFSGAVGQFSFDLDVSPKSIGPGDPITLTMSIKGKGNFDNVNAPTLTSEEGLKNYPPSTEFIEAAPHKGEKIFEQALVVTNSGLSQIPPIAFSYFDPEKKQYQTLFSDPVPITVKTAQLPANSQPPPSSLPDQKKIETAPTTGARFPMLAPVKLTTDSGVSRIQPIFFRPVFLIFTLLLTLGILFVTGLRIRDGHLRRNPERIRQKKILEAQRSLQKLLAEKTQYNEREFPLKALEETRKLLGLLWQTEPASLTTADIALRLGPDHPITKFFTWADRSSYGAHLFSEEEKQHLNETIAQSIGELS